LATGDQKGYRKTCREMLARFGASNDLLTANSIAWTCSLAPDATDPALPVAMAASAGRAGQYEAGTVSIIEAALLAGRIGETFEAIVVKVEEERGRALVALREPAVTARCRGDDLPLGGRVVVRLVEADVMQRLVRFELA